MVSAVALAGTYSLVLNRIADRTQIGLANLFDQLDIGSPIAADLFHDNARPIVEASATAAVETTTGYIASLGAEPAPISELVIADAAARCYDPFDRLARNLANGMGWDEAVAGARSVAEALGDDTVFRTARNTMAQTAPTGYGWKRRLSTGCCQWCMKLSSVEFDGPGEATFGHAHCRCVAVPSDGIGDHNATVRDAAGFDPQAENLYDQRKARRSLRDQAKTARKRSEQARLEQTIEPDPARRERLSIREQEWETRAEAADERLRILETGTHQLAA